MTHDDEAFSFESYSHLTWKLFCLYCLGCFFYVRRIYKWYWFNCMIYVLLLKKSKTRIKVEVILVCEDACERKESDCRVVEWVWWSVPCSSVALCLCVDRRHVAQAAVEVAHLEENALLWAWRELAPCVSLQLLGQAEAWNRHDKCSLCSNFWWNHSGYRLGSVSFMIVELRHRGNLPHPQSRHCLSTCGSHCVDGKCRRENLLGRGHHRPSAPSCRSLRNGSSSESCLGILGNEGGCWRVGTTEREKKNRSLTWSAATGIYGWLCPRSVSAASSGWNLMGISSYDNAIFVPVLPLPGP